MPLSPHGFPYVSPFPLCHSGGSLHLRQSRRAGRAARRTPTWSPCWGRISETLSYWRRSSAHSASSRPCGDTAGSVRGQHTHPQGAARGHPRDMECHNRAPLPWSQASRAKPGLFSPQPPWCCSCPPGVPGRALACPGSGAAGPNPHLFLSLDPSLHSYTCPQVCPDPCQYLRGIISYQVSFLVIKPNTDCVFFIACTCKC